MLSSKKYKGIWRKNKAGGIMLPDFRLYYKVTAIKTVYFYHKKRHIGQQNRIDSPKISPHVYSQIIYDKADKNIQGVRAVSSTINSAGKTGQPHAKELNWIVI